MKIQILIDNPDSWFVPHGHKLNATLRASGHDSELVFDHVDLISCDVLFILSCEKILKKSVRDKNKYNLVVHASDLPKGRGWSPLTWQILEGKNEIPVTMIKAEDKVDSGDVIFKDSFCLEGHELIDEIREKLGTKIIDMCLRFTNEHEKIEPYPQTGESSYYPRRTPLDSILDLNKSLGEQFHYFRVADNERYPIKFTYQGIEYSLKISKVKR